MKREIKRIKKILEALPEIRRQIKQYGGCGLRDWPWRADKYNNGSSRLVSDCWGIIKDLCEPLGLTDTAFREYPRLIDYLVSYKYWEKRLSHFKEKE